MQDPISGVRVQRMTKSARASVTLSLCLLSLCSAEAIATTYTTNFPLTEDPISENGRWIGGQTAGLAWADFQSTPGLAIGKQPGTSPGLYDDAIALLTGTWGPDQTVQATVKTVNQNDAIFEELEIRLRSTVTANNSTGYECLFSARSSANAYVQIVRWNGPFGSFTLLDGRGGLSMALHNGDTIRCTISGSTITAYINGVQKLQVADSAYSSGSPGIGAYLQDATGVNGDYGFTSFTSVTGGELSISGKKLVIKDRAVGPVIGLNFVSRDPFLSVTGIDPTVDGAIVHVFNSAGGTDSACFDLPGVNWRWSRGGLKYLDATLASSPVRVVSLKKGSLRLSARGNGPTAIPYRLGEPSQGRVGVIFTSGSRVLCANFGGTVLKDSGTDPPNVGGRGLFVAKNAAAPGACPIPPDTCP
jgi:hypothetical protein